MCIAKLLWKKMERSTLEIILQNTQLSRDGDNTHMHSLNHMSKVSEVKHTHQSWLHLKIIQIATLFITFKIYPSKHLVFETVIYHTECLCLSLWFYLIMLIAKLIKTLSINLVSLQESYIFWRMHNFTARVCFANNWRECAYTK